MRKLIVLAMVLGFLVSVNVWAEPRWERELKQNGTWSVEKTTAETRRGDAIARYRIYHPESFPLKSPDGCWYVGNSLPDTETVLSITIPPRYTGGYGGWGNRFHHPRHHHGKVR